MIREKYHSDEFDFVAPIAVGSQEVCTRVSDVCVTETYTRSKLGNDIKDKRY